MFPLLSFAYTTNVRLVLFKILLLYGHVSLLMNVALNMLLPILFIGPLSITLLSIVPFLISYHTFAKLKSLTFALNRTVQPTMSLSNGVIIVMFGAVRSTVNFLVMDVFTFNALSQQLIFHKCSPSLIPVICLITIVSFCDNILLIFTITVVSVIPILVVSDIFHIGVYPVVAWTSSLVLLYSVSLFSTHMPITDNEYEYYFANYIITNGYWDWTLGQNLNAMVTVLATISTYSMICDISIIQFYKILIPILSSFVIVGLYRVYEKLTNPKIAFLATFFFFSMQHFYTFYGLTMKMIMAELFLVLLMLLLVDNKIGSMNKKLLSIIFSAMLVTSHYGTTYIFMFAFIIALCIIYMMKIIGKFKNERLSLLNLSLIHI